MSDLIQAATKQYGKLNLSQIPSLASLSAFERAAHYLSFSKAAEELGRTPSAISRSINELEQRFDCQLFKREGRYVSLTPAGKKYLIEVRSALEFLDRGGKHLTRDVDDRVVRLRVPPAIGTVFIFPNLQEFEEAHPEVQLVLDLTRHRADWTTDECDAELCITVSNNPDLYVLDAGYVQIAPTCSVKLLEGPNGLKSVSDLHRYSIIQDTIMTTAWDNWLSDTGNQNTRTGRRIAFSDTLAIFEAVRTGLGVALMYYPYILDHPLYGNEIIMPFDEELVSRYEFKFVTRYNPDQSPRIATVYEWLFGLINNAQKAGDRN